MHSNIIVNAVHDHFGSGLVLVVGDLMLDQYIRGTVGRISPEAPVPVLRPNHESNRAGGAGNLALNAAGLGLRVELAGYVGDDEYAAHLREIWDSHGVDSTLVLPLTDRATITKTRVIAGNQHVLRIDDEDLTSVRSVDQEQLLDGIIRRLADVDAVLLSDYGKGVLSADVCSRVIAEARRRQIPVIVDPKGRHYEKYFGATLLTPNLKEAELFTGVAASDTGNLIKAVQAAVDKLDVRSIVVTRGEHGMTWISDREIIDSPAVARQVFDVSGAGDTVVASLAAGLLAGLSKPDMLHLANVAAGLVVAKTGTAPVQHQELLLALYPHGKVVADSIVKLNDLTEMVTRWRASGERIVFTNGCFDVLHAGHVDYLQKSAAEGDRLIVGLNSDRSVRALKGAGRPLNHQEDRAFILGAMATIDAVVLFDEDTPLEIIKALRPDVLTKVADYTEDRVVGAADVRSWGGDVILIPLVDGKSTSDLIRKLSDL